MSASQVREQSTSPAPVPAKRQKLENQSISRHSTSAKKKRRKLPPIQEGSGDDVLLREVKALLGEAAIEKALAEDLDYAPPVQSGDTLELEVGELSSTGDSLTILPHPNRPWVIVVPFTLPKERIRVTIARHSQFHSHGKLEGIIQPNEELRDPSRIQCRYFGSCGGCQYQMLDYATQLDLKRNVVIKAYEHFSGLPQQSVCEVLPTMPSPKVYAYRTKITPHFDLPSAHKKGKGKQPLTYLDIGFNHQGSRKVLDIEECPIATAVLNNALGPIRSECKGKMNSYKKGVTLLLRESLPIQQEDDTSSVQFDTPERICVTDHKGIIRESVEGVLFDFPANDFFQNNSVILPDLIGYVRNAIHKFRPESTPGPTHLVDTYCGSGLFSISLARDFQHVAGVEISVTSINYARHNAKLNKLSEGKCVFHAGVAQEIFATVQGFPPNQTTVLIDPPRKGCDTSFIDQLVAFRPVLIIYVSCNVHTQARDAGQIIAKSKEGGKVGYKLESLKGFDLFPQTAHVESVAVFRLGD